MLFWFIYVHMVTDVYSVFAQTSGTYTTLVNQQKTAIMMLKKYLSFFIWEDNFRDRIKPHLTVKTLCIKCIYCNRANHQRFAVF